MTKITFDHFITTTDTPSIDDYLQQYRQAGFVVSDQTVRHEPGLRNGFVRFGPEYIEFVWVEDETLFDEGADKAMFPALRELRAARRPFGIGFATDDVSKLRGEWAGRGHELPPVTSNAARDAEAGAPPVWSFQAIPSTLIEGAATFALTYHTRDTDAPRKVEIAPNTTYAIVGVTFATDEPEARARQWRNLLAPGVEIKSEGGVHGVYEVQIGPHLAAWMKPEEYQEQYGLSYKAATHPFGEIAVIHLLATDLDRAEAIIAEARPNVTRIPDKRTGTDSLLLPPDEHDGFTFVVTERQVKDWAQWRMGVTGERIEIA